MIPKKVNFFFFFWGGGGGGGGGTDYISHCLARESASIVR